MEYDKLNRLPVVEQYLQYYEYYSKLYSKVVILYQLGAHYNVFGTIERPTNILDVHRDVNLTLTYRDKSKDGKGTISNPYLCGFPIVSLYNYIEKFLNCGYVVVEVVENKSKRLDKGEYREVNQIYTIGTYISEMSEDIHVVQLYIDSNRKGDMAIGMASININTGTMNIYEAYNNPEDRNYSMDEAIRFIAMHNPQEIYYVSKNECKQTQWKKTADPFVNDSAVDTILRSTYDCGMLSIDDYLDVEMQPFAKKSLALLIHYLHTHNTSLLRGIRKPQKWTIDKYMCLSSNSVQQLDISNNNKDDLLHLLDCTSTKMGSRMLHHRLLNPCINSEIIESRYKSIAEMDNYIEYISILKQIRDTDRDLRFIERGCITPKDLGFYIESLRHCYSVLKLSGDYREYKDFYTLMTGTFDTTELCKYKSVDEISTNIYIQGYSSKIDEYALSINNAFHEITQMMDPKLLLKLELLDDVGYYFKISNHKYGMIDFECETLTLKSKYIRFGKLAKYSNIIIENTRLLQDCIRSRYNKFVSRLSQYTSTIRRMNKRIAEIDITATCRKLAESHKYCRPSIREGVGYIYGKNMRHPIIERLTNVIYVPHTIKISDKERGLLIYGVNSSGKSSIMKSIGVNLIMAQAGMYVAADKFVYTPYHNISTRIWGNDNMYSGQSSFAVEMSELRGILARSGPRSIVFGDEICRGTETVSGTAIAASTILTLLSKSCSFIFTTHLHQIVDIPEIQQVCNSETKLGVYHMGISNVNGEIIYKRSLEPGAGDTLYGLEIAKAMDLPSDFINKCYLLRNELCNESILGKQSKYNSRYFLNKCEICGEKAVDTHHIKPQKDADINGCIGHHHKDDIGNLIGLCKKCHNSIHKGQITLDGYVFTSRGKKLSYH